MEKSPPAYLEQPSSTTVTYPTEKPYLCNICQGLDVAELLAQAEGQVSTTVLTALDSVHDEDMEFKAGIPMFFQHHKSLKSLEASADFGCTLCTLISKCWSGSQGRSSEVDIAIDDAGQGQLFVGTSGYNVSKAEMPLITVTQRPDSHSSRTLCNFDVYSERDSKPRTISKAIGTPVAAHSDSDACKVAAKEWLEDCLANHPQCGPPKLFRRPTRLINVGSQTSEEPPRLEVDQVPDSVVWVALSYCWGGDSKFTLRSDTFQGLKHGILLKDWPATLRDAIKITQSLGIQYIWIDALCIMQDSATDWRVEAARMQDVYSGAAVTVIASESPSTGAGIYAPRPPITYTPCQLPFRKGLEECCNVWVRPSIRNAIDASYTDPVQTRGWTLQEGLLAPRTLSFHKDQIFWECSQYRLKESGHTVQFDHMFDSKDLFHNRYRRSKSGLAYQKIHFGLLKQTSVFESHRNRLGWLPKYITSSGKNMQDSLAVNPYTRWFEIILEYTRRSFTKYSDTLPALGGIARAFATITKDKYCAGMWESELLQCLCWFRNARMLEDKKRLYEPSNMDFSKPTEYRAPSWSWASINGGRVTMHNNSIDGTTPLINIATPVKIHLEPLVSDLYGHLRSGYLTIKGSLFSLGDLQVNYWRNISTSWEQYETMPKNSQFDSETCVNPSLHAYAMQQLNKGGHETFEFEQQHISHPNQQFAAFVIAITEGVQDRYIGNEQEALAGNAHLLLLESTGSNDEYRRIGRLALRRPTELSVIAPEVYRTETRKWRVFEEKDWRRFDEEFRTSTSVLDEFEARAWIEVVKDSPKRTTIRIV